MLRLSYAVSGLVRAFVTAFVVSVLSDVYRSLRLLLGLAGYLLIYFVEIWNRVIVLSVLILLFLEWVIAVLEDVRVAHGTLWVTLDDPLPNTDGVITVTTR